MEPRTLGAFNFKSGREGHIEEAMVIGKEMPPQRIPKYDRVDATIIYPRMRKPLPEKKVAKQSLSPCSYNPNESYMGTQVVKPNIYITPGKYKTKDFIDTAVT